MAWAFRRRIKVIPGVYINLSKSGISSNVGVRGASLTFRSDGIYRNLGLPGTGIYSREKVGNYGGSTSGQGDNHAPIPDEAFQEATPDYSFISADPLEVTSEGLEGLRQAVIDANHQRQVLSRDAASIKRSLLLLRCGSVLSKVCLVYYFVPSLKRGIDTGLKARQDALKEVSNSIEASAVSLSVEMDADSLAAYQKCKRSFEALKECSSIWDITSGSDVDRVKSRSAASMTIERVRTKCLRQKLPGIKSLELPMVFRNRNGADIYIYPGFLVMFDSPSQMGILDMAELQVAYDATRFIETEAIPPDSTRVGEAWEKSNKDGSRDKRFAENRQIPVMQYGEITFQSASGIYEVYMFSDSAKAQDFADSLKVFKSSL